MIGKVYDRINNMRPVATKTDLKVIDGIMKLKKDEIIYMSITELAMRLGVSEATILRFCRKIDYRGFQDFKLSLSQEAGGGNTSDESDYMKNIVYDMTDAITETYKALDEKQCSAVAKLIIKARKICIFGVGNSSIAPAMFKVKLARTGINADNSGDTHLQTIITSNLNQEDLLILISVSGATKDIINLAEIAKKNGTPIVVLTNYNKSPLAKYADYLFLTCRKEGAYEGGSMATECAQSYIVDVLCATVYKNLGEESDKRNMKVALTISDKSI